MIKRPWFITWHHSFVHTVFFLANSFLSMSFSFTVLLDKFDKKIGGAYIFGTRRSLTTSSIPRHSPYVVLCHRLSRNKKKSLFCWFISSPNVKSSKLSVVFPFFSFSLTPKTYCVNVEIYECQRKTLLFWFTHDLKSLALFLSHESNRLVLTNSQI